MKIFLAGGAGYIGTHTAVELLNNGYEVVIVDDYANSCPEAVARVEELTGKKVALYEADVQDEQAMERIMRAEKPDTVIHFAGLKAVGESVQQPLRYYRNNINTTLSLLEAMEAVGVDKFIFSSSATVYGAQNPSPYKEDMPKGLCTNPYGWTKSMMEQILEDVARANPEMSVVMLRYFNPVGAHESGLLGEDPNGIPNNLMHFHLQSFRHQRYNINLPRLVHLYFRLSRCAQKSHVRGSDSATSSYKHFAAFHIISCMNHVMSGRERRIHCNLISSERLAVLHHCNCISPMREHPPCRHIGALSAAQFELR